MLTYNKFVIFSFILMILSGCFSKAVNISDQKKQVIFKKHSTRLNQLKSWQFIGRLSVHSKKFSGILSIEWEKKIEGFNIYLSSWGKEVASLTYDENIAVLKYDNQIYKDSSAELLLNNIIGLSIPVDQLLNWVVGSFDKNDHNFNTLKLSSLGTIEKIKTPKWYIQYSKYQKIKHVYLPNLIKIEGDGLILKLFVQQWSL